MKKKFMFTDTYIVKVTYDFEGVFSLEDVDSGDLVLDNDYSLEKSLCSLGNDGSAYVDYSFTAEVEGETIDDCVVEFQRRFRVCNKGNLVCNKKSPFGELYEMTPNGWESADCVFVPYGDDKQEYSI